MAFSEKYPTLYQLGIRPTSLLDSDDEILPQEECITNATVIELYHFMNSNPSCTFNSLRKLAGPKYSVLRTIFPPLIPFVKVCYGFLENCPK